MVVSDTPKMVDRPKLVLLDLNDDCLGELMKVVELPLVLRSTCRAMRDAHRGRTKSHVKDVVEHVDLIHWVYMKANCPMNGRTVRSAAARGCVPVLEWMESKGMAHHFGITQVSAAAQNGHIDALEWMKERNYLIFDDLIGVHRAACAAACGSGQLETVQWFVGNGTCPNVNASNAAAKGGHMDVLKFVLANGASLSSDTCMSAALGGHLHIIKWLRDPLRANQCPWNISTSWAAVLSGSLEVFKWIVEHGCPVQDGICDAAAEKGNLELLQYGYSKGIVPSKGSATLAGRWGHLHVLKWLHSIDVPMTKHIAYEAALRGHIKILYWVYATKLPMDVVACYKVARQWNRDEILEWMRLQFDPVLLPPFVDEPRIPELLAERDAFL